uniref:Uncharacterized protein n=1 Tax=Odontella aurita TaxID=265563 RepID=A0A7S4N9M7_9STRA
MITAHTDVTGEVHAIRRHDDGRHVTREEAHEGKDFLLLPLLLAAAVAAAIARMRRPRRRNRGAVARQALQHLGKVVVRREKVRIGGGQIREPSIRRKERKSCAASRRRNERGNK